MALAPPEIKILQLGTERLLLEPVLEDHAEELFGLFADEQLHKFVPFMVPTAQEQQDRCRRWARRISPTGDEIWLNWAARHRDSRKIIGHFQSGYKNLQVASIGYVVAREFQGQGLALEALVRVFEFLRNVIGINEVRAWSDTRNIASHRLAAKLGMKQIEFIKNADFFKDANSDEYVFSLKFQAEG